MYILRYYYCMYLVQIQICIGWCDVIVGCLLYLLIGSYVFVYIVFLCWFWILFLFFYLWLFVVIFCMFCFVCFISCGTSLVRLIFNFVVWHVFGAIVCVLHVCGAFVFCTSVVLLFFARLWCARFFRLFLQVRWYSNSTCLEPMYCFLIARTVRIAGSAMSFNHYSSTVHQ